MKNSNKSKIKLPVQTLNWRLINTKSGSKPTKIILQFEVGATRDGRKLFSLVAYPAYKKGNSWSFGPRINMPRKYPLQMNELRLPITLGNLELHYPSLLKKIGAGKPILTFKPRYYSANPHASYDVIDSGTTLATANPSPPARPVS